jgi:hypothetical protein
VWQQIDDVSAQVKRGSGMVSAQQAIQTAATAMLWTSFMMQRLWCISAATSIWCEDGSSADAVAKCCRYALLWA